MRDIEAARAAGIACGAVTWGYAAPEALKALKPDLVFESAIEDIVCDSWRTRIRISLTLHPRYGVAPNKEIPMLSRPDRLLSALDLARRVEAGELTPEGDRRSLRRRDCGARG